MGTAAAVLTSMAVFANGLSVGRPISGLSIDVDAIAFWVLPIPVIGFFVGWQSEQVSANQCPCIRVLDLALPEPLHPSLRHGGRPYAEGPHDDGPRVDASAFPPCAQLISTLHNTRLYTCASRNLKKREECVKGAIQNEKRVV